NRDIINGGFALTEDGTKVIFRYTLQIHNLDQNEFDAAINSLSLLMSEYYNQLISFSKL
ncbi:MAG TPA: molecular chaperone Tir, partial [Sphingobacterium sp.]|nr:molecular chaperone Tir [Sphingobacterium sp.]